MDATRVRCGFCGELVRVHDPGNGCAPWLITHDRGSRGLCAGSCTTAPKFGTPADVEPGPVSESQE